MATAAYPFVVPQGLREKFSAKVIVGPSDSLIEASHISTKNGVRPRDFCLKFYTDSDQYKDFGRRTTLPGKEGDYWPAFVYVTDVHWLSKNRCHIMGEETSGGTVVIENYNYRTGKGNITVYEKDYHLDSVWKGGYPPEPEVVPESVVVVAFAEDVPLDLLHDALRLRGYKFYEIVRKDFQYFNPIPPDAVYSFVNLTAPNYQGLARIDDLSRIEPVQPAELTLEKGTPIKVIKL